MRRPEVWVERDGLAQLLDGSVILARIDKRLPEICIDDGGERVELLRAFHLAQSLVEPPERNQASPAIEVMGIGIVGVQLEGALELFFGAGPVPIIVRANH